MFRPRGGLAKVLYEKIHTDARLQSMDKEQWYCIDDDRMKTFSEENWKKYVPLELDDSTQAFLDQCQDNSDNTFWQLWLTISSSILSWFLAPTSVNGLLGRGSMHVFSSTQFQTLIQWDPDEAPKFERLLDIGAGDGETTQKMESCFNQVFVTELSIPMKWSLQKKGYTVLNETSWCDADMLYDVVSCLNVLDRCESPLELLDNISKVLKPNDGLAIVSFVIPFNPYVEFDSKTHSPSVVLPIKGGSFEEEVNSFIEAVLKPKWEVIRWTRLPYLCEGDIKQSWYWLNDAVFLIRPIIS